MILPDLHRGLFVIVLVSLLLLAVLPGRVFAQMPSPIRLATQLLPPYQMIEDGEMTGIAIDRVRCALDGVGLPYELHMMDLTSAQLLTESGKMDGFFVASQNPTRARFAVPSAPVIDEALAWYMRPGLHMDPVQVENRLSARYSAKFATNKWFNLHHLGYNVVMKPRDADSLLTMLINGDIDVALEYELVFEYFMARRGIDSTRFRKLPYEDVAMSVYFARTFDRARPAFRQEFDTQLRECKRREQ